MRDIVIAAASVFSFRRGLQVYNITKTELAHRGGGAEKGVFQFCTDVSDVIYFVPLYAHE